jgi:TRAP-type transport system small permease protein
MDKKPVSRPAATKSESDSGILFQALNVLENITRPTNRVFLVIAGFALTGTMVLTFLDVVLRVSLNMPIYGALEMTDFLMGILVAFSLGYCALRKSHIRVDLLLMHLPPRIVKVLDIGANGTAALFCLLVAWQTFVNTAAVLQSHKTSPALLLPVFPFVFLVVIGITFVSLVFFKHFLESIYEVGRK